TKTAEAWAWRSRGTHERAQDDGATLTDRVQSLEKAARQRWTASSVHAKADGAKQRARLAKWRVQRRLNESLSPTPGLLAGDLDAVLGADRVVLLAEYALSGALRPEALSGAAGWAAAGVPTLVVSARDAWSRSAPPPADLPDGVAVVSRPNVGYDFGSWGAALAAYPELAAKRLVILTNDSLAGPYGPLDDLLARIEASTSDVWAATQNHAPHDHLQSYLLAFRGGVLGREPLRSFFGGVRAQESKRDVVQTYEFGLSAQVEEHGLTYDVGWTKEDLQISPTTDSILGAWPRMLSGGFPFVKRTLLEQRRFDHLHDSIATVVRQEYGAELR
ncbi:MAG: rhamnan synthesis F family protein, partial [Nocardioides sp.]